ncbi:MAG: hypothetical protein Q8O15_07550 [Rectinemataceae bacterium]|nr:hypothetical protein [Rectinemataceae bacterium]
MPILKPFRKETFWRDFLVIQGGFAIFGLSLALMIRANLGTSSWSVLEVALSRILSVSPGTMTIAVGFLILGISVALREEIGWGTLTNIIFVGLWIDLFLYFIPSVKGTLLVQIPMLVASIPLQGLASGIYIGVDAGAGPRDSLMLAIHRTTGISIRMARIAIEITVVLIGWALGGPAGVGTLIFALLIGPSVQWGFRVFKVTAQPKASV